MAANFRCHLKNALSETPILRTIPDAGVADLFCYMQHVLFMVQDLANRFSFYTDTLVSFNPNDRMGSCCGRGKLKPIHPQDHGKWLTESHGEIGWL